MPVAFVSQPSCNPYPATYAVFRMIPPVTDRHLWEVKGAHALNTGHVHPVLIRRRTTLVEGVDAALRAEVVLGLVCVELIKGERFLALGDSDVVQVG